MVKRTLAVIENRTHTHTYTPINLLFINDKALPAKHFQHFIIKNWTWFGVCEYYETLFTQAVNWQPVFAIMILPFEWFLWVFPCSNQIHNKTEEHQIQCEVGETVANKTGKNIGMYRWKTKKYLFIGIFCCPLQNIWTSNFGVTWGITVCCMTQLYKTVSTAFWRELKSDLYKLVPVFGIRYASLIQRQLINSIIQISLFWNMLKLIYHIKGMVIWTF